MSYALNLLAKQSINSFPDLIKVVSSANIATSAFSYESGRSLMNIRRRNGPRTDSCGTPVWIVSVSVPILFNLMFYFRSFKKRPKVSLIFPLKPYFFNFDAFCLVIFLSICSRRYAVTLPIACTHDISGRNPNWTDVRTFCFEQKDIVRFNRSFSKTLLRELIKLIGR